VKELRSAGFSPDFIVCRAKKAIEVSSKNKISLFCNVDKENVLSIPDVSNIYHVPLLLLQQDFHHLLSKKLNLNAIQQEKLRVLAGVEAGAMEEESKEIIINKSLVKSWEDMVVRIDSATDDVSIALIGKYTNQQDSYLSVISALKHSCIATDQKLKLLMIESSSLEQETKERDPALFEAAWKSLKSADGILVPGTAHEYRALISKFQPQTIQSPRCHYSILYYPVNDRHSNSYLSSTTSPPLPSL
jgi:CTP synthase